MSLSISLESIDKYTEYLNEVESLSNDDIHTLLDNWVTATQIEGMSWRDVQECYRGDDGFFYFVYSSDEEEPVFDIFDFIANNSNYKLGPVFTKQQIPGKSRGLPRAEMGTVNTEVTKVSGDHIVIGESRPGVSPDLEDGEATGVFDEDEYLDEGVIKYVTLEVRRTGDRFDVTSEASVVVGRSSTESHVQILGNQNISRAHALFVVNDQGELYVEDLGSTNGTFIDGLQVTDRKRVPVRNDTYTIVSLHREEIAVITSGVK